MIRKIALSLAALAIAATVSLAPAPAAAQHHSCGGSVGEGCWTPRQQQQQQRNWGLPEWEPQQRYGAPVPQHQGRIQQQGGMRQRGGSHGAVVQGYFWNQRTIITTCMTENFVIRNGVLIVLGYTAC